MRRGGPTQTNHKNRNYHRGYDAMAATSPGALSGAICRTERELPLSRRSYDRSHATSSCVAKIHFPIRSRGQFSTRTCLPVENLCCSYNRFQINYDYLIRLKWNRVLRCGPMPRIPTRKVLDPHSQFEE